MSYRCFVVLSEWHIGFTKKFDTAVSVLQKKERRGSTKKRRRKRRKARSTVVLKVPPVVIVNQIQRN